MDVHYRYYIINDTGEAVITGLERERKGETKDIFENIRVIQRCLESNSLLSVQEVVTIDFFIGKELETTSLISVLQVPGGETCDQQTVHKFKTPGQLLILTPNPTAEYTYFPNPYPTSN